METIQSFIFNSNINIFYSIIVTLIIFIIFSIIKKATKAIVTLSIVCALIISCAIFLDSFNEKYNLRIEDKNILITIENETYNISDFENIENIYFKQEEYTNKTLITIDYKEDNDVTFELPTFMSSRLKEYINEKSKEIKIIENNE